MTKTLILLVLLISALLVAVSAGADSHLPQGILVAQNYNKSLAEDFLKNATFFIAFLAGITSILSPCILPLLPAYFAVTFKEKRRITLATTFFFLGFTTVFIAMGLLATLTGETLISVFRGVNWLVPVAGLFLILFGIMIFLGFGFSGFLVRRKFRDDPLGVLAAGAAFGIGWTVCIGPILSGMLLMASTFQNYATASFLMFAYSLGLFLPIFVLSFFYDRLHIEKLKWLYKEISFKLMARTFHTNIPNVVAGGLFIVIGGIYLVFRGTWIINGLQMFGLRQYFYSWQNLFLENTQPFNIIGFAILALFSLFLIYFLSKELRGGHGAA